MTSPADTSMRNRKRKKEQEAKKKQQQKHQNDDDQEDEDLKVEACQEGLGMTSPPVMISKKFGGNN